MTQLTFILTIWTLGAYGQCTNCEPIEGQGQICWGNDRTATEEHYAKFADYSKLTDNGQITYSIKETLQELNWLLENAPCLNNCMYYRYEKYLNAVVEQERDKKAKKSYLKKLAEVKRLKAKYFPIDDPKTIPCR